MGNWIYTSPLSFEDLKIVGDRLFVDKDFVEAIEIYTEALKLNKSCHFVYSNRSAAYLQIGNPRLALKDAVECIRLSPSFPKGFSRKGDAYYELGKFEDAISSYEQGLSVSSTKEERNIILGKLSKTRKMKQDLSCCRWKKNINLLLSIAKTIGSSLGIIFVCFIIWLFQPIPDILPNCVSYSVLDDMSSNYIVSNSTLSPFFSSVGRIHGVSIDKSTSNIVLLGEELPSNITHFPGKLKLSDFAAAMLITAENPSVEIAYSLDPLHPKKEEDYGGYLKKIFYPDHTKSKYYQDSTLALAIHDADWFIKVLDDNIDYRITDYDFSGYQSAIDRKILDYEQMSKTQGDSNDKGKKKDHNNHNHVRLWWTVTMKTLQTQQSTQHEVLWIADEDIDIVLHVQATELNEDRTRYIDKSTNEDVSSALLAQVAWVNDHIDEIVNTVPEIFRMREIFIALEIAKFCVATIPKDHLQLEEFEAIYRQVQPYVIQANGDYTVPVCQGTVTKRSPWDSHLIFHTHVMGGVRFTSSSASSTPRVPCNTDTAANVREARSRTITGRGQFGGGVFSGNRGSSSSGGGGGGGGGNDDEPPVPYRGGSYAYLTKVKQYGTDRHHIIPKSVMTWMNPRLGLSLEMKSEDHRLLGSSRNNREHFQRMGNLLDQGKQRSAIALGIREVRQLFGNTYNVGLREMLSYIHDPTRGYEHFDFFQKDY